MSRRPRWGIALAACILVTTIGVACGGDDDEGDSGKTPTAPSPTAASASTTTAAGTVVEVQLNEFSVVPDKGIIPAGSITFRATNGGPDDEHELVIVRSDLAPGALPTAEDGSVPEDDVDFVDEIEGLAVGESGDVTVDLAAGKYILLCNVVQTEPDGTIESHYEKGMYSAITVN